MQKNITRKEFQIEKKKLAEHIRNTDAWVKELKTEKLDTKIVSEVKENADSILCTYGMVQENHEEIGKIKEELIRIEKTLQEIRKHQIDHVTYLLKEAQKRTEEKCQKKNPS